MLLVEVEVLGGQCLIGATHRGPGTGRWRSYRLYYPHMTRDLVVAHIQDYFKELDSVACERLLERGDCFRKS